MVNARRPGLLAYLLVVMLPGPALAWGDTGHRIICEIAFEELEPIARDRVKAMINRDPGFDTFVEALKYLGHWVGDLHQPLHVSFEDDRGGNSIGVSGGLCSWNLHAVWDRCDAYALARQVRAKVTDQERATWQGSSPIDWANESFAISTSPAVRYCVGTENGCWYDAGNGLLDEGEPEKIVAVDQSCIEGHAPTVREQLVKAGVRLSGLLNQVLGE